LTWSHFSKVDNQESRGNVSSTQILVGRTL
jgi:hypothetical protein